MKNCRLCLSYPGGYFAKAIQYAKTHPKAPFRKGERIQALGEIETVVSMTLVKQQCGLCGSVTVFWEIKTKDAQGGRADGVYSPSLYRHLGR